MTNKTPNPSPDPAFQKLAEAFGGAEKLQAEYWRMKSDFDRVWERDSEMIGRILKAHMTVEYFLTRYIEFHNPNLNRLENVNLAFAKKVQLVGESDFYFQQIRNGVIHLNKIRNKIAHHLKSDLSNADSEVFLAIGIFKIYRQALADHGKTLSDAPIIILEEFATCVAAGLQAGSEPNSQHFVKAYLDSIGRDDTKKD